MRRQRNDSPGLGPDLKHHISQVFKDGGRTGDATSKRSRHPARCPPRRDRRRRRRPRVDGCVALGVVNVFAGFSALYLKSSLKTCSAFIGCEVAGISNDGA
ncbi:hypothetical protein ROHU_016135 [Labeo rohita]|uniref:Uncharacterized protein n=1 Tax=Labeo rohita TaxID=84645 RepID=A0A498NL46_LABRO|nr:hypothetical protein ROHU_016135 [Labeo rohita]